MVRSPASGGGQRLAELVPGLAAAPNYAWSFECITPESSLCFGDAYHRLEIGFDWLMHRAAPQVLGVHSARFGTEFPIRFDFLDTIRGGNLSVQCHPGEAYMRREFGETMAQDETYYILECEEGARVFLGLQEGVQIEDFRAAAEAAESTGGALDVDKYVRSHPSSRHQLFLIPHGTVHGAGAGNLVLEVSATPYIFTFKLYDWQRAADGAAPRPMSLERGFSVIDPTRSGALVDEELVSTPEVIARGQDWCREHLPTHSTQFFDLHRHRFDDRVDVECDGSPHVLMLVGGTSIELEAGGSPPARFTYAETFVVPAGAGRFTVRNLGDEPALLIDAFLKPIQPNP